MIKEKWLWMWQEVGISSWGQVWAGWLTRFSLSNSEIFLPSNYLTLAQIFQRKVALGNSLCFSPLLARETLPCEPSKFACSMGHICLFIRGRECGLQNGLLGWRFGRQSEFELCSPTTFQIPEIHCGQKEEADAFAQREKPFFPARMLASIYSLREEHDQISL